MSYKPQFRNKTSGGKSNLHFRETVGEQQTRRYNEAINDAYRRLGKMLHPKFEMQEDVNQNYRKFGFMSFWDFDTARLQKGYALKKLKANIRDALQASNPDYFVLRFIIGYGNLRRFSPYEYCSLTNDGFRLYHVIRRIRYCTTCNNPIKSKEPEDQFDKYLGKTDLPDTLLVQSMYYYAMDVGASANMLVMSSDPDLATPIATLKSRKFKMFVAANEDANPLLFESGHASCYWDGLCAGKNCEWSEEKPMD